MQSNTKDIQDLEDIIKILVDMLLTNNISKEEITLKLRIYHYCFDCYNHFRNCKCGESSSDVSEIDDNYTSSIYSDKDSSDE